MTKRTTIHVVPRSEGWAVRKEGNSRAVSIHSTQREAVDAARKVARTKRGELIIHRKDGRISERDSYSTDPLPPKSEGTVLFHQTLKDDDRKAVQAAVDIALQKPVRGAAQHVVPYGKGWAVRSGDKTKSRSVYDTQNEAIEAAKELLPNQNGKLLIHDRHGKIRKVSTSGRKSRPAQH